ncbi:MAG: zinc ribbon domain-containing protein [Anaerolineae bacterium]|nr:zinc ribbon domain-containing protein [Anaerolineae bacterium]
MPIYEYECGECGIQFQKLQRFGDAPPETCPRGHADVHRLLSQPAIIFKGAGFYVTDNRRNGATCTSGKGDKKKAKAESKASSKEKPDTKKS